MPDSYAVLVDAHVHYYDCFDPHLFLDAARRNFSQAVSRFEGTHQRSGCLMLCETAPIDPFLSLQQAVATVKGPWTFKLTNERESRIACRDGKPELLLIAGRQIVTRENLEVLALGTCDKLDAYQPIAETIDRIVQIGAVPVLPWGFGKWWFQRGRWLKQLLRSSGSKEQDSKCSLFIGDNGGRNRWVRDRHMFALAESLGIRNLPGSDPLPMASHVRRAGSYGFVLDGELDWTFPASQLKRMLRDDQHQPESYGCLESLGSFFRNQFRMQLQKRRVQR